MNRIRWVPTKNAKSILNIKKDDAISQWDIKDNQTLYKRKNIS